MNPIFPILVYDSEGKNQVDTGTGFFINEMGYFVSAGHVFKNSKEKFFAEVGDLKLPIKIVYKEYLERDDQKTGEYRDLMFGKIIHELAGIAPLSLASNIASCQSFIAKGYSKQIINEPNTTIEELWEDDVDSFSNELRYYELPFRFMDNHIYFNPDQIFMNGFCINMKGQNMYGMSGGPVICNDLVSGVLVTTDNCVGSTYIMSKLKDLNIYFKSKDSEEGLKDRTI